MTTLNRPVTSREYKLMLNVDHFRDRKSGIKDFWQLVEFFATRKQGTVTNSGDDQDLYGTERRLTSYLDTPSRDLRRRNSVVRLRKELNKKDKVKEYKITLKYRSPDRYISANQAIETSKKGKYKFEEDIVPPFLSRFSQSVSVAGDDPFKIKDIKDLIEVFPSLKSLGLEQDTPIEVVNDFVAHERAIKFNRRIQFKRSRKGSHDVEGIKPALSFWYLEAEDKLPLVTEFSFDYDALQVSGKDKHNQEGLEEFAIATVIGAEQLFRALQKQQNWINLAVTTKTAYAYEGF